MNNAARRADYGGRGFLPAAKQPYTRKPMQFVCSSGDAIAESLSGDAIAESLKPPSVDVVATEIGQFEIHTRGIGSRLMAKMGFIPGKGLGKDGQGIAAPVVTEFKHDKLGLGFLTAAAWPSSEPATEEPVWTSWDSAKKKMIADATTTTPVVSANPWEGETSKARPELWSERKKRNKELTEEYGDAITTAIEGVKKQQSSGNLTLSSLMETFSDLKKRFTEEYETSDISSVAASLAYPLLVEVFWGWKPEDGEDLLQGLLLMSSWKDLLSSRKDCLDDASVYSNLVRDVVLPVVKEWGDNSWNVMDPQPMIAFLELWELLLPPTVRDLILEEVVMTKLLLAVESWDPRLETTPIHVWVHPWCTLLGTRFQVMCEIIRVRMGEVLDSWEPSDQSGFDLLSPWKYVFDSASWEMMMTKYIVPKLKSALKKNKQSLEDQFNWVMRWASVMPTEQIVALLEDRFFGNWLRALELWFRNSDTQQVSTWFESWKAQFSSALLADERIQVLLSTALSMIDQQKEREGIY